MEPNHKEFAFGPNQAWLMQEFMNETRRVYTDGRPHATPEGNTGLGDSIGFWDGDRLVVWTTAVKAADYLRGLADSRTGDEAPDHTVAFVEKEYLPVGTFGETQVRASGGLLPLLYVFFLMP